jgi:hypothetical protein
MSEGKKFVVATPVVWAGAGAISQFAGGMSDLVTKVNETAQRCGERFKLVEAFVEVHSTPLDRLISFPKVALIACERDEAERRSRGMAHWWYSCVSKVINRTPDAQGVLYYPIDVCWDDNAENTVVNPFRVCAFLKQLAAVSGEALVLGNYTSTNPGKELIEDYVLHLVRSAYPELAKSATRVRTEFWAITPGLFAAFEAACPEGDKLRKAADPTLLLLMYCLHAGKPILTFDLGTCRAEGEYDNEKIRGQVERAREVICDFQGRFAKDS